MRYTLINERRNIHQTSKTLLPLFQTLARHEGYLFALRFCITLKLKR